MKTPPNSAAASNPHVIPSKPPTGFVNLDVGRPALPGSVRKVDAGWDLIAGGADIWEKSDQFHFLCKQVSGDFDIAVRVESFTPAHLYSKAGLMIRETLNADSPHLMLVVFAFDAPRNNNLGVYEMQFRAIAGGNCQAIYPQVGPPNPPEFPAAYPNTWLRMERRKNCFWSYASTDGKTWKLYGQHTMALADKVYLGPALTSHDPQALATAGFREYKELK